jgi:hypothetical protein
MGGGWFLTSARKYSLQLQKDRLGSETKFCYKVPAAGELGFGLGFGGQVRKPSEQIILAASRTKCARAASQ